MSINKGTMGLRMERRGLSELGCVSFNSFMSMISHWTSPSFFEMILVEDHDQFSWGRLHVLWAKSVHSLHGDLAGCCCLEHVLPKFRILATLPPHASVLLPTTNMPQTSPMYYFWLSRGIPSSRKVQHKSFPQHHDDIYPSPKSLKRVFTDF